MKIAKSHKIVMLFTAFVMSLAAAFGLMNFTTASADTASTPAVSTYFKTTVTNAKFDTAGLVLTDVANDNTLTFKNSLVLNNLSFEMVLPENAVTTISFKADSYYVNGNKKVEGETTTYETEILNQVKLTSDGTSVVCLVNDNTTPVTLTPDSNGVVTLALKVEVADNYLTVNGQGSTNDYYKIRNIDNRVVARDIEFKFTEKSGTEAVNFTLVSVNQNDVSGAGDKYTQSLTASAVVDKDNFATPRVVLDSSVYTRTGVDTYEIKRIAMGTYETISYNVYPVLGSVTGSHLIKSDSYDVAFELNTDTPKKLLFNKDGTVNFGIGKGEKVFEEFTADVDPYTTKDENKPEFISSADFTTVDEYNAYIDVAIKGFQAALDKAVVKEHEGGIITSVHLGAQVELPSYEDLVYDDYVPYKKLTKTVHYFTPTQHSDSTSLKITVSEVGAYQFVATFSDGTNAMAEKDIYEENDNGTINHKVNEDLFFRFEIKDDAPISVIAKELDAGYKTIEYDAIGAFDLEASGCTTTYTLWYNADADATADAKGWIEIPKAKDLKESEYQGTFSYDEVMETAYDGRLTFVPTRTGAYKFVCSVTSDFSKRSAEASTIVKIGEPTTIRLYEWIQNNVWSVVFLSVGTLCLIGIIVLLCIKPKEELVD